MENKTEKKNFLPKDLDELKRQLKSELREEFREELKADIEEELKSEYWIQREEMFETLHCFGDLLCSMFDESARPKVEKCFQMLREATSLEIDEALECIANKRKGDESLRLKKAVAELDKQMVERESKSRNRWMYQMPNLKHYVVEFDEAEEKFPILEDLLNRHKNYVVVLFMKANDEVEDLCCSVNRKERYNMIEYLLPGLTRKNAIASVMGGNVRVVFAKNDLPYGYHGVPNEPLIIINYDFYTRTRTYLHRLRLSGYDRSNKGIVINLVEQDKLEYLGNLEAHYQIVMEPLTKETNIFAKSNLAQL